MKKGLLLLVSLGYSIFWIPTYATIITIDLGPPSRVTGEKIASFSDLDDLQFNGQTLSLDLVFGGNSFVRLFTLTRSALWSRLDLLDLLRSYGTAGGSFRCLGQPEQGMDQPVGLRFHWLQQPSGVSGLNYCTID